jgi:hypothetical protein
MTEAAAYKTIITTFVEQNEVFFIIGVQAPFWIKTFINSGILNQRDKTQHFILFLNPFSRHAMEHGFECILRLYWKPVGDSISSKKTVNILSLIFGIFILSAIVNNLFESWMNR